jgi:hypothetical protein
MEDEMEGTCTGDLGNAWGVLEKPEGKIPHRRPVCR